MPRSNSKASATSPPPPDKVVGGLLDNSSESECVNSVCLGVIDDCEVINVDSVPGSSIKKSLEKPCCGPSEQVSLPTGDYFELLSQFVTLMEHRGASSNFAASKWHDFSVVPTRPSSTERMKGSATFF